MTALEGRLVAADPVLGRLGGAVWRALPALAVLAVGSFVVGLGALWLLPDALAFVPFVAVLLLAPLAALAVDRIHRELFEERSAVGFARKTVVTAVGMALPTAFATWSTVVAAIAGASGSVLFQIVAVAAVVIAVVLALIAVMAVPIACMRGDAGLRSIATFALLAVIRRPTAPLAALGAAAAVTWLGLTVFSGLLAFVLPALIVLSVAAAWTTAARFGLTPPALNTPLPAPPPSEGTR